MQIGIRLHDVEKGDIAHRAAIAHKQGFKCAHIALSKLTDFYKMTKGELTPGWAMELRKTFSREDIDIAVLGCYLNLATPDAEKLKMNQEVYKAHLRFNTHFQAGVVGTETGAPNVEYKYCPECHTDESLKLFINNLKPVVKYAESLGQILALEPVYKHIMYNPKRARQVLDEIGSPNLQIIFDPVNLLDISNYENREEIIGEAIELLADDIAMIHIKDFIVENNQLNATACGKGLMNYEAICKFAKEKKPGIHVTLENTKPENAVEAREYLEGVFDRA